MPPCPSCRQSCRRLAAPPPLFGPLLIVAIDHDHSCPTHRNKRPRDDTRSEQGVSSHHRRRSSATDGGVTSGSGRRGRPRVPFGQPVSINFGRPDIEKFVAETVRGTAVEGKWASAFGGDVEAGGAGAGGDAAGGGKLRSSPPPPELGEEDGEELPPTKLRTVRRKRSIALANDGGGGGLIVRRAVSGN